MTITPWSDAAKALVGAAFGNPEMRAKAEEMQLKRDQFGLEQKKYGLDEQRLGLDEKKYGLDEAYNPARIGQAEASAGFDRARTATEALTTAKTQIELDNILKFLGEEQPPQNEPSYAPMPEFNPNNVGPQGQGRNPAINTPYDQIQPLDALPVVPGPAVSDQEFADFDVRALPPGPEVPLNPMTMGGNTPVMEEPDQFAQLIAGLTGAPTRVVPPNGAAYFEDLGPTQPGAQEPMRLDVPTMAPPSPTGMITPEMRQMIAAGYLAPENIGDLVLAAEGQGANRGVTDPSKRIQNAAAGTGTFLSPDQVLAQALGATRDTATLGDLAENNLGTADIQNFEYGQENPAFTEYLAAKDAGQEIEFGPDGKVTRIGKGKGGPKPLTEAQGKNFTSANALEEPLVRVETMLNGGYEPNLADYTLFTQSMNSPMGASIAIPTMSPEGQQFYGAVAPVAATIANILSGQGMTDTEQQRRLLAVIPIPGEDRTARALKVRTMRSYFESADTLGNPGGQPTPPQTTGAPVQITGDADYEALAPGTTFIAPDGSQRVKP